MSELNLNNLQVASPCEMPWDEMTGDDRSRFCGACQLNVYNLSAMTSEEAETLMKSKEGRLCVRFFRREDGTILTQDCPVGLKALKSRRLKTGIRRVFKTGAIAAASITLVTVAGVFIVSKSVAGEFEHGRQVMGIMAGPSAGSGESSPVQGSPIPDEPPPMEMGEAALPQGEPIPEMGKPINPSHSPRSGAGPTTGPEAGKVVKMGKIAPPPDDNAIEKPCPQKPRPPQSGGGSHEIKGEAVSRPAPPPPSRVEMGDIALPTEPEKH